jgi:AraC-like DNA-binding protein
MAKQAIIRVEHQSDEECRAEAGPVLDAMEARFGMASARLVDAFRDETGELVETEDFWAWDDAYLAWRRAGGPER